MWMLLFKLLTAFLAIAGAFVLLRFSRLGEGESGGCGGDCHCCATRGECDAMQPAPMGRPSEENRP